MSIEAIRPLFSKDAWKVLVVLFAVVVLLGAGGGAVLWAGSTVDDRAAAKVEPVKEALNVERQRGDDHEQRIRALEEMRGDLKAIRASLERIEKIQ